MADDEYQKKLKYLRRYVPFLKNMIKQLSTEFGRPRGVQIVQLQYLLAILTDPEKKLDYDTLTKCEKVIIKLYEEDGKKQPTEAICKYMCRNPPEFTPETHSPILDSEVTFSVARQKLIKQIEPTPTNSSPPFENATMSNPMAPVVISKEKQALDQLDPTQNKFNSQLQLNEKVKFSCPKEPFLNDMGKRTSDYPFLNNMGALTPYDSFLNNTGSQTLSGSFLNMDDRMPSDPFSNNMGNRTPSDLFLKNVGNRIPGNSFFNNMDGRTPSDIFLNNVSNKTEIDWFLNMGNRTAGNSFIGNMTSGNPFLNMDNNAPQNMSNRIPGNPFFDMTPENSFSSNNGVATQQFNYGGLGHQDQFLNRPNLNQFGFINHPNQPQNEFQNQRVLNINTMFPNKNTQVQQNFNIHGLSQINPIEFYDEKNQRQSSFDDSSSFRDRGASTSLESSTISRGQLKTVQNISPMANKKTFYEDNSCKERYDRYHKENAKSPRKSRYEESKKESRSRFEDIRGKFRSRSDSYRSGISRNSNSKLYYDRNEYRRKNSRFSQNEETSQLNESPRNYYSAYRSIYGNKPEERFPKEPSKKTEEIRKFAEESKNKDDRKKGEKVEHKADTKIIIEEIKNDYIEKAQETKKNEKADEKENRKGKGEKVIGVVRTSKATKEKSCDKLHSGADEKLDMFKKFMIDILATCDSSVLRQHLDKFGLSQPCTKRRKSRIIYSDSESEDEKDEITEPDNTVVEEEAGEEIKNRKWKKIIYSSVSSLEESLPKKRNKKKTNQNRKNIKENRKKWSLENYQKKLPIRKKATQKKQKYIAPRILRQKTKKVYCMKKKKGSD